MQGIATFLLRLLAAAAAVGAAVSILALLLGALRQDAAALVVLVIMVVLGVPCIAGMIILQFRAKLLVPLREVKKVLLHGNPKRLRWFVNGLAGLGVLLWFTFGFLEKSLPFESKLGLVSGAFGLFVFPIAYAYATSYLAVRPRLLRKCTQGHALPLEAAYCPTCGQQCAPVA